MNKLIVCLLAVAVCSGCTTGGPVIGPWSYMAAQHNQKLMTQKAMLKAQMAPEKKAELFKAVAMGADPRAVAVGIGVDLFTLAEGQYSWGEAGTSFLGALGDLGTYSLGFLGVKQLTQSSSDSNKGNLTINGNVSGSQIQVYQGNTGLTGTGFNGLNRN